MPWDGRAQNTNHDEYAYVLNVVQCAMHTYETTYVKYGVILILTSLEILLTLPVFQNLYL